MSIKQRTIRQERSIKGKSLHTGEEVTLTLKPADANAGYVFRRVDLYGKPEIRPFASNVTELVRLRFWMDQRGLSLISFLRLSQLSKKRIDLFSNWKKRFPSLLETVRWSLCLTMAFVLPAPPLMTEAVMYSTFPLTLILRLLLPKWLRLALLPSMRISRSCWNLERSCYWQCEYRCIGLGYFSTPNFSFYGGGKS